VLSSCEFVNAFLPWLQLHRAKFAGRHKQVRTAPAPSCRRERAQKFYGSRVPPRSALVIRRSARKAPPMATFRRLERLKSGRWERPTHIGGGLWPNDVIDERKFTLAAIVPCVKDRSQEWSGPASVAARSSGSAGPTSTLIAAALRCAGVSRWSATSVGRSPRRLSVPPRTVNSSSTRPSPQLCHLHARGRDRPQIDLDLPRPFDDRRDHEALCPCDGFPEPTRFFWQPQRDSNLSPVVLLRNAERREALFCMGFLASESCEDVRSFVGSWGVRATTVPRTELRRDGVDETEPLKRAARSRFRERVVGSGVMAIHIPVATESENDRDGLPHKKATAPYEKHPLHS
jgi:hypothetical protein